jgi:DNA-binding protein HU-beta
LKKGYKIPLLGLGKLYVRKTKARMGRNPATGEPIHIPSKKRIRFTASKSLKQAVLFS